MTPVFGKPLSEMCNQKTGQSDIKLRGQDKKTARLPVTKWSNGKRDAARDEGSLRAPRVTVAIQMDTSSSFCVCVCVHY